MSTVQCIRHTANAGLKHLLANHNLQDSIRDTSRDAHPRPTDLPLLQLALALESDASRQRSHRQSTFTGTGLSAQLLRDIARFAPHV